MNDDNPLKHRSAAEHESWFASAYEYDYRSKDWIVTAAVEKQTFDSTNGVHYSRMVVTITARPKPTPHADVVEQATDTYEEPPPPPFPVPVGQGTLTTDLKDDDIPW